MKRLLVASLFCASLFTLSGCRNAKVQPAAPAAKETNVTVIIETSLGTITAELFADKAPITVSNVLSYVDDKFYDGTIFHRVMKGFMIQGGGFTTQMQQKATKDGIQNEANNGLKNDRGTLSMARRGDPNSATSQFFINHVNNAGLNRPNPDGHGYAVFGKVIDGMDIVDKIAAVPTGVDPITHMPNVPTATVEIKSIRRKEVAAAK